MGPMKRTSLSSNFKYLPPPVVQVPPRASFDDDRDLDALHSRNHSKVHFDFENWQMIDDVESMVHDGDEDEETIETEKRWFAFQVENCPPSLKLLVRFFRFFQFSFSGIVFKTSSQTEVSSNGTSSSRRQSSVSKASVTAIPSSRSCRSRFISFFILALNFFVTLTYIVPFLMPEELEKRWGVANNTGEIPNRRNSSRIRFDDIFSGEEDYFDEFMHLKPILRNITKSIIYVFMVEGLFQFTLNLFLGGRLISRISRLPDLSQYDSNRKLACRLLVFTYLMIATCTVIGSAIYIQKQLRTAWNLLVIGSSDIPPEDIILMAKTCLVSVIHQQHYFLLSMASVFFVYTMIVCRRAIDSLREEVANVSELSEWRLFQIKSRLNTLSLHLSGIVSYFALPLTITMASNAFYIIGTSCFLMIHQAKENDYFIVFIFNVGAFALARLIIICVAGNTLTSAHQELLRAIYEKVDDWSLGSWMAFLEIKRLTEKFEVSVGGVYSVRQSTILTVLGFALNYIVVLLQTENYGTGRISFGANFTNESAWTQAVLPNGTV